MIEDREYAIEVFDQEAQEYDGLVKDGLDWNGAELKAGEKFFIADEDPDGIFSVDEEGYIIGFYEQKPGAFGGGGLRAVVKCEGMDVVSVDAGVIERAADQD